MIDTQIKLLNNNKYLLSYINKNKMFFPLLKYNIYENNNSINESKSII